MSYSFYLDTHVNNSGQQEDTLHGKWKTLQIETAQRTTI